MFQARDKMVSRNIFAYLCDGKLTRTSCSSNLTSVTQKQIWQKHLRKRKSCCLPIPPPELRRNCDFSERARRFKAGSFATSQHIMSVTPKSPPEKWTIFRTSLFFSFSLFCADGSEAICQPRKKKASGPTPPWV